MSDLSKKLQKFLSDSYKVSYLDSHVKGSIAYQIQALREKAALTQEQFGALVGMPQAVVSRLENTEQGGVNVNTLLKIANGLKIGLEVKFCNFETVLATNVSPVALHENIHETIHRINPAGKAAVPSNEVASSGIINRSIIEGSRAWQTSPVPNQPPPPLEVFPGSGIHNFGRSTPMPALPG